MQPTFNLFKALLFACLLLLIAPFAQATFTINNDGTVTDPTTGLTWMRCAMGQTWDGSTCTGTASTYTYDGAKSLVGMVTFAGHSDWRLPNIRELQTIVGRAVRNPAIVDSAAFPKAPTLYFWSSSPNISSPSFAWFVNFSDGGTENNFLNGTGFAVRLVRSGQSFSSLLSLARPNSDYVDNGNGTVTHTPTNLTWMRCAMGQTWTGSTCSGKASSYNFSAVNSLIGIFTFAGYSDWRLPTEDELVSLVDYSIDYPGPTINGSVFPATPSSNFWSGSLNVGNSSYVWSVDFSHGSATGDARQDNNYAARLVRSSGQLSSSSTPVCTISANPPTINAGSSSTLTATCNPAASSYTWTGGTCAGTTGATCTVAPSAATSYTVTGVNTGGNGNTASAVVRIAGNTTSYTVPGTLDEDVFVLTAGNSYYGGGGNDTYIISPHTLRGAVTAKIIDNEGTNVIQLANGMTIASSSFFNNALQLMLSNGAIVQVLGASSFIYQLGANASAGEAASNLSFAQFAAALGANVPAAGAAAVSGSANFVVQR